ADVERRELELSGREAAAIHEADKAAARLQEVMRREAGVKLREREAERQARREAREYLLEARREIEGVIAELRQAGAQELEEAARRARRTAEAMATEQKGQIERLDASERRERPYRS